MSRVYNCGKQFMNNIDIKNSVESIRKRSV